MKFRFKCARCGSENVVDYKPFRHIFFIPCNLECNKCGQDHKQNSVFYWQSSFFCSILYIFIFFLLLAFPRIILPEDILDNGWLDIVIIVFLLIIASFFVDTLNLFLITHSLIKDNKKTDKSKFKGENNAN